MKSVLLRATLALLLWLLLSPLHAQEVCVGPACVGQHRDRDRDHGRMQRERDHDQDREQRRRDRDQDRGERHERRERNELCVGPACVR